MTQFVLHEFKKKLDSKARIAMLVGYPENSTTYVVSKTDGSETRASNVWLSQNVNFVDDEFPYQGGSVTLDESGDNEASQ